MKSSDPPNPSESNTAVGWGEEAADDKTVPGRAAGNAPVSHETTIAEPIGVARSPLAHEAELVDPSIDAPARTSSDPTRSDRSPALANTELPGAKTARGIPVETGESPSLPGYRAGEMLGRGGMGEVVLADDLDIGRKVAIKRLHSNITSEALVARFLREAKIQALLDHPAIVPVHEVGRDAEGRPYFTMKRLQGTTLSEVIKTNRESRARMLRAFADVCLAIELAHARGFIHRDLKPANIMLGEYGEVYVIDWGLARAVGETDPSLIPADGGSLGGETQVGVVMGTPGYMSPEQVRGESVGPPTDVYALGAIFYEILTRQRLHPSGGDAALASTLSGGELSPAAAAPDRGIPPELDRLCVQALASDPDRRPSARVLADGVQKYLDGDRDLERRRQLATELIATARADLESDDPARRGNAIKAAGRALALDPESEDAAALVAKMMIEPPKVMPPALAKRLDDIDVAHGSAQARRAGLSLGAYFLFLPVLVWMGVLDWGLVTALYLLVGAAVSISLARARWSSIPILGGVAINSVLLVVLSRFTSPFVIVPTMVVAAGILFAMFPQLIHRPWLVIGNSLVTFLLPVVLEVSGVWSSTWRIDGGRLITDPTAVEFDGTAAKVFLIGITVVSLIVLPLILRSVAVSHRDGRRQLEVQAWHLHHLIPTRE